MRAVVGSCDRAREWLSADLDGELSELERALLHAHVVTCSRCDGHLREIAATTVQLRFSGLAQPDFDGFSPPPRRRLSLRAVQAAAAATAVAAGLGMLLGAPTEAAAPAQEAAKAPIVDVTDLKLSTLGRTYLKPPQRVRPPQPR